ncbi:MAG: exodeoxyribonuclease III [Actinobacteria bacterium]|nr:exodeoxyribonuclease III [Actinomycetota bacterium]
MPELKDKKIKIVSWNVNGLRAIGKKGFKDFVSTGGFDIVCLQETKVQNEKIPAELKSIGGYDSYFSHAKRPGYSGVAIYSKIKPFDAGYGFGIERFDDEGRVAWLDFNDFILFNTYMPNGGRDKKRLDYKLDFYYEFLKYLKILIKKGKNIIITGDINTAHRPIDLARPKQNANNTGFLPQERAWIDRLLDAGFLDTFRIFNDQPGNYTWWDYKTASRNRNVGWRIDYFFATRPLSQKIAGSSILSDIMGSDHCPILLEIYSGKLKPGTEI